MSIDLIRTTAGDLTTEQREAFEAAADAYYALPYVHSRDPEDDIANVAEDDHALTAILQSILGEDTLTMAGIRAHEAQNQLDGWVRASAALGVPERTIEEQSGLSRMTIRKRLGK